MRHTLVFRKRHFDQLTSHLYRDRSREAMALGYYRLASGDNAQRLLVQNVELPVGNDYHTKTPSRVSLSAPFLERGFKRCESEGVHLLDIHTHPWAEGVGFSSIDDSEARCVKGPYLKQHVPGVNITYLLFGSNPTDARVRIWNHELNDFQPVPLIIIW